MHITRNIPHKYATEQKKKTVREEDSPTVFLNFELALYISVHKSVHCIVN